ncbi:septum formation initiator family protein [bacterium]|nr:septum formation initiator family protein [bacterium]
MKLKENKVIQGLIIFCIIIVVVISIFGDKGFLQLMELKRQEKILVQEIEDLKEERREWISKINSLKNNQTYMETLAREQLGMVRNNEMMIRLYYNVNFESPLPSQETE